MIGEYDEKEEYNLPLDKTLASFSYVFFIFRMIGFNFIRVI